jgi:hypothetical protein
MAGVQCLKASLVFLELSWTGRSLWLPTGGHSTPNELNFICEEKASLLLVWQADLC